MRLFHAQLETRHFEFNAYGETRADARAAMMNGLRRHAEQYDIDFAVMWSEYRRDLFIQEVELGRCYRVGSLEALQ